MRNYRLIIFAIMLGMWGCKTSQTATSSGSAVYEEDLSALRPDLTVVKVPSELPVKPVSNKEIESLSISTELDSVNKMMAVRNQTVKYIDGYTIQIYTGNDRNEADQAKEQALSLDVALNPTISYYQPSYKVKVGQYATRLEAHKTYESLKKQFPRALLVPERIKVNYE
jgi:septal ring-binding cell division protein DamX